jgi:hypothetical protein
MTNPSSAGMSALGAGISGGSGMLSQFYLDQAKHMSPVLRVSGGRSVEINLTQGVVLRWQDRSSPMIADETQTATAQFNNGGHVGSDNSSLSNQEMQEMQKKQARQNIQNNMNSLPVNTGNSHNTNKMQITSSYDDGSNLSNMSNSQMNQKMSGYMQAANNTDAYLNKIQKQH